MKNQDKYIESLYAEESISAEAYLFCLDHCLETIADLKYFLCNQDNQTVSNEILLELKSHIDEDIYVSEIEQIEPVVISQVPENIETTYLICKEQCSVRTRNVLDRLECELNFPAKDFFDFLLFNKAPLCSFKKLKNSGAKTVSELISLTEDIKGNTDYYNELYNLQIIENPTKIDKQTFTVEQEELLEIIFDKILQNVSVRSCNALKRLRKENGNFADFYHKISSPDFDIIGQKNVGKGCVADFHNVIKKIADTIILIKKENTADIKRLLFIESKFGLTEEQAQQICDTVTSKIEYPVFAIIKLLIESDERMSVIVNNQISIFNNQVIADRNEVAAILGITQERVRQLRNTYLEQIIEWIACWQKQINNICEQYSKAYSVEYDYAVFDEINKFERVNFNSNFISTVLYLLNPNCTTLIGDYNQVLLSDCNKDNLLHIISRRLSDVFDFNSFINDIGNKLHRKVFDSYTLNIREHILCFFKSAIDFELMPDIFDVCRKIIYKNFELILQDELLLIEQNATKNIPDILEDILRTNNRIMSLDELYDEIEYQYPCITKSKTSLRGSILRNSNIAAISRTSNYTLKEWIHTELRGGTIRDIVFDFLNKYDVPQSIELIAEYVLKFRPSTNSDSIYTNLFSDQTKRFSLYENNGSRSIGLSHKVYSHHYELIEFNDSTRRKSFDESMSEIEFFIDENGRYPFSSGVNAEEERLNRFLAVQNAKMKKGYSSEEEFDKLSRFEAKYGHLRISKRDYMWNVKFEELEKFVFSKNRLPIRSTDFELYTWFYDQYRMVLDGKLSNEQRQKIELLKSMYADV